MLDFTTLSDRSMAQALLARAGYRAEQGDLAGAATALFGRALWIIREQHREAFVAGECPAANDDATREPAPVPALPAPVAAFVAELDTERAAHGAAGALAARWERRLAVEPTREQRDAIERLARRVAVRQSVPALCAADLGFVDFTVGAAVSA